MESLDPGFENRSARKGSGSSNLPLSVYFSFLSIAGLLVLGACTPATSLSSTSQDRASAKNASWADRLRSGDAEERAAAAEAFAGQGAGSVPVLRQLLRSQDEYLHVTAMDVVHRIGPDAIGLLTEMLDDRRASIRRSAVDILVDLAPDTEPAQPSLQ